jgi:hypothetical protein
MNKRNVFFGVPAAVMLFFCAGGLVTAQAGNGSPVIYAAGDDGNAAMVWKIDGSTVTPIPLTDGKRPAGAWRVIESGGGNPPSIYAAGREGDSGKSAVMVWKIDGSTVTPIPLTDGTDTASVLGIAETGGSVYAAGYKGDSSKRILMVWKIDGSTVTPIPLTDGSWNNLASGIAESGGSVYVAGSEYNKGPRVWKVDGSTVTPIPLTVVGDGATGVSGITESGGSVYVAGTRSPFGSRGVGAGIAMVWKIDGSAVTPIPLTDGKQNMSASTIAAGGGGGPPILYAGGDANSGVAMVWKIDGSTITPIPLTDGTGGDVASVERVAASGVGDPPALYAVGSEGYGGSSNVTRMWKIDGSTVTPIPLTKGTGVVNVSDIVSGGVGGTPSIYAAGSEKNSGGTNAARVWKIDGSTVTAIPLTDGKRPSSVGAVIVRE